LVDFATHARALITSDIKVAGGSVDSLEATQTLRTGLHVGFPMWAELDAVKVSADTGAPFHNGDTTYLHGTGWLLNPDGEIVQSLNSTGPIGRFTASDIIRKVLFERR